MTSSLHHKVIYVTLFNLAVKDGISIRVLNIAESSLRTFDEVLILSLFWGLVYT